VISKKQAENLFFTFLPQKAKNLETISDPTGSTD
jgi:hypothetical protein